MGETLTLPLSYYAALFATLLGIAHGLVNLDRSWSPPYLAVLVSFFGWYLVEPLYAPDTLMQFNPYYMETAYSLATLYLITFIGLFFSLRRSFVPIGIRSYRSIIETLFAPDTIPPDRLALIAIGIWVLLLAYGTSRLDGDIMQALFPLDARAGVNMWQRYAGAQAGPTGFLVSTAAYLYTLSLAAFGILLPIVRKPWVRVLLILVIAISWPYAFLQGSRNITLAVVAPLFASIFLFTRLSKAAKVAILGAGFLLLESALRAVIAMRNSGFDLALLGTIEGQRHLGLNMASELIWVVTFLEEGYLDIYWGSNYLAQALNFIPRAIWPDKPLIGIEYASVRGYGGIDNDIGVIATISTGNVGQGVLNFGLFLGPIVAALLIAVWANLLHRLRLQGTAPRLALYVVGLALTFNLGRDITLLVLFPFVFGYFGVRVLEKVQSWKRRKGAVGNEPRRFAQHR